jgi:hypothetical protein
MKLKVINLNTNPKLRETLARTLATRKKRGAAKAK